MPFIRRYVDMPKLTPQRQRELDRKAAQILLQLPDDLAEIRYVHEKVHETINDWVLARLRDDQDDGDVASIAYLKIVKAD